MPSSRRRVAFDLAPIGAVLIGAAAQKLRHQGVELGLLELLLVALALPAIDRVARAISKSERSPLGQPVAALLAVAGGLGAFFVYPLPPLVAAVVLGWAIVGIATFALEGLARSDRGPRVALFFARAFATLAVLLALIEHAVSALAPAGYDASIYFLNARWTLEGIAPYRDSHLNKLPGILLPNLLYAALGDARLTPQVVSFLCVIATGAILARARAVEGAATRALVFGAAVTLLSLGHYRQDGNFPECYASPLLALAWSRLAASEPSRRDLALGGMALGGVALLKQTLGLYAFLGVVLASGRALATKKGAKEASVVPIAALATFALGILPFAVTGLVPALVSSTFLYWTRSPVILAREGSLPERLLSVVLLPAWPAFALALVAALGLAGRALRERRAPAPVLGWFALLAAGSTLQLVEQRLFPNPHYATHLLVALALGPWAFAALGPGGGARRAFVAAVALGAVALVASGLLELPERLRRDRAALEMLRALGQEADRTPPPLDRPILTIGVTPAVYLYTSRRCAAPLAFSGLLVAQEAQDEAGRERLRARLAPERPVVLLGRASAEVALVGRIWPGWEAALLEGADVTDVTDIGEGREVRRPR